MKRLLAKSPRTLTLSSRNGGEGTAAKSKNNTTQNHAATSLLPLPGGEGGRRPDEGVCAFRRGVTMTEVLMSMLIMSIGVSSVAVLFPISVLRSVQATQLTNAAILMTNAKALVQMRKELLFDPDGDGNLDEHIWNKTEQRYIVDPAGYFEIAAAPGATWSSNPTLNDPAIGRNDPTLRGLCDWFGNIDSDNNGTPEPFDVLPRYDGGIRTATMGTWGGNGLDPDPVSAPGQARSLQLLGSSLSKLGDGWETKVDTIAEQFVLDDGMLTTSTAGRVVGLKLPDDLDLTDVQTATNYVPRNAGTQIIPDPDVCRIVVFSVDGRFSVSLPLIAIGGSNIAVWTEDINFSRSMDPGEDLNMNGIVDGIAGNERLLPAQFYDATTGSYVVGRVLLQSSRTHDYNWLLTVRRGSDGQARGVDVVVTHNKSVTPDDERLYTAGFVKGSYTLNVFLDGGLNEQGDPIEPALKRSGYLLDVTNARWYRVQAHREASGIPIGSATGNGYQITLESPVIQSAIGGKVMFLPGVIDVYPMGSVSLPTNR